ncbi:CII-binding regulator of phage lambda lysogenization HflD [Sinorhizobium fredii]
MGQLMNTDPVADSIAELNLGMLKLERRLQRERNAPASRGDRRQGTERSLRKATAA